jgi:urease accessory protein
MGPSTARISADDFVTPPEFKHLALAANEAGRIGGVRLELVNDKGRTTLGHCYQQVPLRVVPPFQFEPGQPALLYLLNPTAGLMDGDGQRVEIHARAGAQAIVVGQSATRIHPCLHRYATQQWHVHLEPGARLVLLPGPAIPFENCRYFQRVVIDLAEGANLAWGDIWLAGRYARGAFSERYRFQRVVQELTVRRSGALIFRDRFCWAGPWSEDEATWHFGNALACGSLFVTGKAALDSGFASDGTSRSTFATAQGDTCFRWTGAAAAVTADVVKHALRFRDAGSATPERHWAADGGQLAPNHWFSRPPTSPS